MNANPHPVLELKGLSKNFAAFEVTKNIDLSVRAGERVALIGPNGAGKTTIFNLISGVYQVSVGRILAGGTDITDVPSRHRIRHGVARSFQNIRLIKHLTVIENLVLGQHVNASGLANLVLPFGLSSRHRWWREAREHLEAARLGAYADKTVDTLSYGLRKRVDLVRALLARPKILLLDEPAAGLNPTETVELLRELQGVSASGVTLLVVEHDMHFVRNLCDRIVVLNFGQKIAEGTMAEVQQNPQVQAAYLGTAESEGVQDA